ncbi:MAE_28990/MAE_18760 family HEPN-like nuclease [Lysinibacillus sphaericus]|uniref:MAE_28990/MAE_18760 family HEPN-like nuclease n=1 Tax=Lysinibacillus sphaericus TaxID=1421 RepID=UPI0006917F77|nr:MAE_28990/MAE_18760 family HEPN-like nuclease [Lysinibacillus sphaericus]QPA58684.1 hypothetical protein INQ55_22095 [Lysinibacillus sphaericus]
MDAIKILSIVEELESELTWRELELKFLKNQLSNIESEDEKKVYRKALVVMLYAHYEGFCSFAFQTYVLAINEEEIIRREANSNLIAASLHQEFSLFESEEYKETKFKKVFNKPVDDKKLYKLSKRIYLLDSLNEFLDKKVEISDKVVNTESNLWPIVLKKLLYTLGLPENTFIRYEATIKDLVNTRNGISHGQQKEGIDEITFNKLEQATTEINKAVIQLIQNALKNKEYLKEEHRTS